MRGWTTRGLVCAALPVVALVVSLAAPSAASAACTGESIKGNGSSLQALAQETVFTVGFDKKCASEDKEQVTYESTGSGAGLASWWIGKNPAKYKGFGASNAFVGTDQPPNEKQEGEILEKGSGKVLSIPVLQAAITVSVHLPENCLATALKKTKLIKRLIFSDAQLQGVFAHTIKTWKELVAVSKETNPFEDKIEGTGCNLETPITRVVREDGSGTTATFKKFLYEINKSPVDGTENWNELAEANENLHWPAEGENLVRGHKNPGVAEKVVKNAGSIGYVNLADARNAKAFDPEGGGGAGTALFWGELQSKGKKFEDPSTDGDESAKAQSNCAGETYVSLNGSGKTAKYPPASTEDVWNEVTASTSQKASYPLCGFTYDLSLTEFSKFSETEHVVTAAEVETVKHYFEYMLSEEGQNALKGSDYLGLPEGKKLGNVLKIAREGAAKIA